MKQLVFHGKKTVPRALRRDVWRPYFSIHFPKTPGGAAKGLLVFQELRELSMRRQLKPPKEMVIATDQDIQTIKNKYRPHQLKDATERSSTKRGGQYTRLDMPVVGMRLPKKMIARRLMNQRGTAVADVAAVLKRHVMRKPANLTLKERADQNEVERKEREAGLSSRNHKRLQEIRKKEDEKAEDIADRMEYVKPRPGYAQLQRHTKDRISMEYEGLMYVPGEGMDLKLFKDAEDATQKESGAARALEDAMNEMEEEKEMQRETIEKEISAQIEQRLVDMTAEQRSEVQKGVEEERARKEVQIDEKIADAERELETELERMYKEMGTLPSAASLRAYRQYKRKHTARITAMKTDERLRHLKWTGPFAEINTKVNEAIAEIQTRWQPKLDSLLEEANKEEAANSGRLESHEVEIRWADLRDGTYAREWPDNVFHGELQAQAVVKADKSVVRQYSHFDADEHEISEQRGRAQIPTSTSIHVFGTEEVDDPANARWQSSQYLAERAAEQREQRASEWSTTEIILMRRRIVALRAENRKLHAHFAGSIVDKAKMEWTVALADWINVSSQLSESLTPESYDQKTMATVDSNLAYVTEHLQEARDELTKSDNPDADRARHDWIANSVDLIKLESTHLEARRQADLREEFLGKFDEREGLMDEITAEVVGAESRLSSFDVRFPFVKDVMIRHGINVEGEAMKAAFEDIEETRLVQQEVLGNRQETLKAARSALLEAEANNPSVDGSDAAPVADAKAALQRAMTDVIAAEEVINETRAKRTNIISQIQAKSNAMRNDREAWREFKEQGGTVGMVSAARRKRREEDGRKLVTRKGEVKDDVVVIEPTKGVWGRVKGLFGRK